MSLEIRGWRATLLAAVLLAAATFAVYLPSLGNGFIDSYDDADYVTNNPVVERGLTAEGLVWAFTRWHSANWHPLTWISHMVDCAMYGLDPWGHHLTSLLLHAANAVLLLLLLDRATGRTWRSAAVAGLFAVHPLHVESVAWVAERKDVLSAFFALLAALAYVGWTRERGRGRYALVVGLYALALMSKPMVVTLPFVLVLLDDWPLGRMGPTGKGTTLARALVPRLREKAPLLALAALSCVITYQVQLAAGAVTFLESLPFPARLANALLAYVRYAGLMVVPTDLAVLYPYPDAGIPPSEVLGSAAAILAATALAIRFGRRLPYLPVGWFWYLGTLVPVIGLVQVGLQSIANRYTYLPLVGLFLIVVWGAADLAERIPSRARTPALAVSAVAAMLALGGAARVETRYFRDSIVLFERTLAITSNNAHAQYNLGAALARRGDVDQAIAHYREAVRIDPGLAASWSSLGGALLEQGKAREAIAPIEESLRLNPRAAKAQYNFGLALADLGRTDEAVARYGEALRLLPEFPEAHYSLAVIRLRQGKWDAAIGEFSAALRSKPEFAEASLGLGSALVGAGRPAEGLAHLSEAVRLKPADGRYRFELARAKALVGDFAGALGDAREARRLGYEVSPALLAEIEARAKAPR